MKTVDMINEVWRLKITLCLPTYHHYPYATTPQPSCSCVSALALFAQEWIIEKKVCFEIGMSYAYLLSNYV